MKSTQRQTGRMAAVLLAAAAFGLGSPLAAQDIAPTAQTAPGSTPTANLQAAVKAPVSLFDTGVASNSSSSSASSADADALAAERFTLSGEMQPPPRRRYGRPRYTDNQHNPDGSSKYTYVIGGGFTLPTGGSHNYLKTGWSFQGGIGRNFNKNVGVLAQFDWDNFGLQTNTLDKLLLVYNTEIKAYNNANPGNPSALLNQLGASSHLWSFTLNPIYNFSGGDKSGAYVVAGAGFYHKRADITTPSIGSYCDYYGYCYQYQANQTIDSYTSNAVGVNAGIGFTYKPSRFANQKLFAEARYVYTANQRRPYYDGTIGTSLSPTYFNILPQNSAPTTYIPVKVGLRF